MAVVYDKSRKRWRASVGNDRDGTRSRKWFASKSEATSWERTTNMALGAAERTVTASAEAPQYQTMDSILDHLWRHTWSHSRTARSTQSGVKIVRDYFHGRPVSSITTADVDAFVNHERARGMTPATVNRRLTLLSQALRWAEDQRLIDRAPRVRRLKEMMPRDSWLELDEVDRLIAVARSWGRHDVADYITVLVRTGMRMSEALMLKAGDVDLGRGMIRVRGTKTNRMRYVPVFPSLRPLMEELTAGKKADARLFEFSYNSFEHTWSRLREVLGWTDDPQKVPYILRHTFASLAVQNGMPLDKVSRILGHTGLNMTMRYAKLAPEHLNGNTDPF